MTVYNSVSELVGKTPLLRLKHASERTGAEILAKLEYFNPANSVKDRIGVAMIDAAEESGQLKPGGTIVEATSGNTGIDRGGNRPGGKCLLAHGPHARRL